jgi:hypothetical protein
MRKEGVIILLFLVLSLQFILADVNQTDVDKAYSCLEEKIGDCSTLPTTEISLSILATPEDSFDSCVTSLKNRQSSGYWGNIKDSALAILALDHAGQDTTTEEEWLNSSAKDSNELVWYLQIDSDEDTVCSIIYDNNTYSDIKINEDKTLSSDAGSCLTRANNNYFLSVNSGCFEKTFEIKCEDDFIVALAYKTSTQSPTLNLLDDTKSALAYENVEVEINSKCFGEGSECDFETSAWAVYTLLSLGHDVKEYLPYLIATADSNEIYRSNAFLYLITKYEPYATSLLYERGESPYWEIDQSPYNTFYDSALAVLALGKTNNNIDDTLRWFYFSQNNDGCWEDSVRDTAIILWATEQKQGKVSSGSTAYCEDVENQDYFCVNSETCEAEILGNFYCSGSNICCSEEPELKTCEEVNGTSCESGETCVGNSVPSSDAISCCLGECREEVETLESACELADYSCRSTCGSTQEEVSSLDCDDSGDVCCRYTSDQPTKGGSKWWIWLILVVAIIGIGTLVWLNRNKIFKKDKPKAEGGMPPRGPGIPPLRPTGQIPSRPSTIYQKPGFPPIKRP